MLTGVRPAVPAPMPPGRDRRVGHQPANTFCNPATMAGRGLDRKQNANGAGDLEGERRGAYAPPKRFQDEAERRTERSRRRLGVRIGRRGLWSSPTGPLAC